MVDFVKLKKMMSCQVCGEGHVNIIIIIIILFMSRFFYLIFYGLLMLFLLPNGHVIEFVCFLVEVGLIDKKKKKKCSFEIVNILLVFIIMHGLQSCVLCDYLFFYYNLLVMPCQIL